MPASSGIATTCPRSSRTVWSLSLLIAGLALVAALPGVLLGGVGEATGPMVTSVRGEAVQLYGRGLYELDTRFIGAGNRATDALVSLAGLPLLGGSLAWYRRGALAGGLLLLGTLAYFLYVYGTYAVAIAYTDLFLVHVTLFSASLFGFVRLFVDVSRAVVPGTFAAAPTGCWPGSCLPVPPSWCWSGLSRSWPRSSRETRRRDSRPTRRS